MTTQPLFLSPTLQERIWGGDKLKTEFHYDIPSDKTGEAWVISAHENGPSTIENGPLKGKTLTEAWENNRDYFNRSETDTEAYPLLVKILDATEDLSVQVHPDDTYAREKEGVPYGKTECWYVLDAEEDAKIVFGHHAETNEELKTLAENGEWDELLRYVPVKKGDFIYVPSGSIHAIGAGIVILETQQSSDITYRVYDYDRTDDQGNTRELHLDQSIDVTTVPHKDPELSQTQTTEDDLTITHLVEEQYFTVEKWTLTGEVTKSQSEDFLQLSVIDGEGTLTVDGDVYPIKKGAHFILPYGVKTFDLAGNMTLITSYTS
ncbi:mannose-6-phosphate isomerase, class I [Halolactibacillus sp. JCM 19043]|uniref:mannose-6-phosphate isomerase, class I n=1 Tax=Halolactibacillus sp. JCM 19043 TaxID=1460638 RepID=UPI000780D36A|nr:mannose-6-phosphate isomerase, class I [Halolactibacillus sp. JCM 19043]